MWPWRSLLYPCSDQTSEVKGCPKINYIIMSVYLNSNDKGRSPCSPTYLGIYIQDMKRWYGPSNDSPWEVHPISCTCKMLPHLLPYFYNSAANNTIHWADSALILAQPVRRRPNINSDIGSMYRVGWEIHQVDEDHPLSWQIRGVHPRLVQYWPTVCDAGPTLNQPRMNASCMFSLRHLISWFSQRIVHQPDGVSIQAEHLGRASSGKIAHGSQSSICWLAHPLFLFRLMAFSYECERKMFSLRTSINRSQRHANDPFYQLPNHTGTV